MRHDVKHFVLYGFEKFFECIFLFLVTCFLCLLSLQVAFKIIGTQEKERNSDIAAS